MNVAVLVRDSPEPPITMKEADLLRRNKLARIRRREREQAMRDCGLVKGKTSDGRTIWE